MSLLSDIQLDALTESFNLGMGAAAAAMSEMVNEDVLLSVPELNFVSRQEISDYITQTIKNKVSGVAQEFSGPFTGKALLLFSNDKSLDLVRLMLQDAVPLENLTEFEEEALNEIGNIIINAGLSSLADMFGFEILSSLPSYIHGEPEHIMEEQYKSNEDVVMLLKVNFNIASRNIEGYVIYVMEIASVKLLQERVDHFLKTLG